MGKVMIVGFHERPERKLIASLAKAGWQPLEVGVPHLMGPQPIPHVDAALFFFGREGYETGRQVLAKLAAGPDEMPIICVTRQLTVTEAVEVMKLGAFDFVQTPVDGDKLRLTLQRAAKAAALKRKVMVLESQVGWEGKFDDLVGASASMREIFQMIQTVAKSNATALIVGESGTGKELVARSIHRHSERFKNKFIDINCGAIPRELLENELFGHEKGAFTGADRQYLGSIERAHGGVLFLDEVSEMDPALQVKLLRVLQERKIVRVGGSEPIDVDIRVIAATNRDLKKEVEKGTFREDLFYRLNVVPIQLPPLRDRREDVPVLAQHFLEKFSRDNRRSFKGFTPEAMEILVNYDWPGNVRELENNIERVVVLHDDSRVRPNHLPRFILSVERKSGKEIGIWDADGYQKILPLNMVEQYAIEAAIERCRGDIVAAAKKLGIGQATMYRKVKRYGIRIE